MHACNLKSAKARLPKRQVDVELPKEIADKLNPIAMKIGEQFRLYGLRAKINFRSLLKCLAYRNGRRGVTEEELDALIAGCGPITSTFLQLLKETAMRAGEAHRTKWTDIYLENKTIRVTPEKGSNP